MKGAVIIADMRRAEMVAAEINQEMRNKLVFRLAHMSAASSMAQKYQLACRKQNVHISWCINIYHNRLMQLFLHDNPVKLRKSINDELWPGR